MSEAVDWIKGVPHNAPEKWTRNIEEQAKRFRTIFGDNGCPLAIFTVPVRRELGELGEEEIPAPARRIKLVAEAHELGHSGAEKTPQRL